MMSERYLMKRIENSDIPDNIFKVIKIKSPEKAEDLGEPVPSAGN
jgi:hypothetical protein